MAEGQFTDDEVRERAARFDRPLPGESLTNDPETPLPFEGAPKYTDQEEILNYFFELFTSPEVFEKLMDTLDDGTPVMDLVQVFLIKGFQDGLYNPDLMMLLAEPLAYMLIALAERQGIDVEIMREEGDMSDDTDIPSFQQAMSQVQPTGEVPEEIQQRVEPTSLLARGEQ